MHTLSKNIVTDQPIQQELFSYNQSNSLSPVNGKKVALDFQGGSISSDAGVLLMRETEARVGIVDELARCISDSRRSASVMHPMKELMEQRVYQIICGYADANDSDTLRFDPTMKMAIGRLPHSGHDLASQPTITRFENRPSRTELYRMAIAFVDHFLRSYSEVPQIIVLDVDDTANVVHGYQQMSLFNGYYQENCYEPLHLYEGLSGKLIATFLRPGRRPNGHEIVAYMRRIINRIRQQWPDTIIVYRGDSHYSLPEVFTLLAGQKDCYSVTGLGGNAILLKHVASLIEEVRQQAAGYRRYHTFYYQAQSWSAPRKVVAKVEMTERGLNTRFISTDMMEAKARMLYEEIYSARGNDELYIKEHKTYTQSDRSSCHRFEANQFRLFMHSAAYVLMHAFRSNLLKGTGLATATFETIRSKLLKTGARIIERKTKIDVHLPTAHPCQGIITRCLAIFEHLRSVAWSPPIAR
jgi:hypothetical protein